MHDNIFLRIVPTDPDAYRDVAETLLYVLPQHIIVECDDTVRTHGEWLLEHPSVGEQRKKIEEWTMKRNNALPFWTALEIESGPYRAALEYKHNRAATTLETAMVCHMHPLRSGVIGPDGIIQAVMKLRPDSLRTTARMDYTTKGFSVTNGNKTIDKYDLEVLARMQSLDGKTLFIGCVNHGGIIIEKSLGDVTIPKKAWY